MINNLITEQAAADGTHHSLRSFQMLRRRNQGPDWVKVGRSYFYDRDAVRIWMDQKKSSSLTQKFAAQNTLLLEVFGPTGRHYTDGLWELEVDGKLTIHVREDGQSWLGFTDGAGNTVSFEATGFRRDGQLLWSPGDITISQIKGIPDDRPC